MSYAVYRSENDNFPYVIFYNPKLESVIEEVKGERGLKGKPWVIRDMTSREIVYSHNEEKEEAMKEESLGCEAGPNAEEDVPSPLKTAEDFLNHAIHLQKERGKQYDTGDKERSMGKVVEAFNAICGETYGYVTDDSPTTHLTESQGWLFMCLLKMVRSESKSVPHRDSLEDFVSYASLYAEARANGK